MNILAIDTSGNVCSAAVLNDGKILSEVYMDGRRTHSETLGDMVDYSLSCAALTIREIDLFACAIGPGSFTGLRIGAGFVKGCAHASSRPVIGVNALDALARNVSGYDAQICPVIDARRGDVYTAVYKDDSRISDYHAKPLKVVLAEQQGIKTIFLGDAAVNYAEMIRGKDSLFDIAPPGIVLQRAGSVGLCAFDMYAAGVRQDVYTLEPFYLRETQAERVLAEKQGHKP